MSVFKQDGFNTINVETGIQQRIKELRSSLPAGMNISVAYDQADYIRSANKGVKDASSYRGHTCTACDHPLFERVAQGVHDRPISSGFTFRHIHLHEYAGFFDKHHIAWRSGGGNYRYS